MEISPLIRTRMFSFGYNANFIVYPNDFTSEDIDWAMSCVDEVMSNNQTGIQRLVASKGDKKIAGFACTLSEFVKLLSDKKLLSGEEQVEAKNYTCDEVKRSIPAFLGYAFKNSSSEVPSVPPEEIWRLFMKNLKDKWHRKFVQPISASYNTLKINSKVAFSSEDENLFKEYLAKAVRNDIAVIIENATTRKISVLQLELIKKKPESPLSEIPDSRHMNERKDSRMKEPPLSEIPDGRHADECKDSRMKEPPPSEIPDGRHADECKDSRMKEPPPSEIPDNRHAGERKKNFRNNHIEPTPQKPSIPFWLKVAPGLIALGAGVYLLIKWFIR